MEETRELSVCAPMQRRRFLKYSSVGIVGASVFGAMLPEFAAAAQTSANTTATGPQSPGTPLVLNANDIAILNFALNLEYLEAEFYTVATTGKTIAESGIEVTGTGKSGPTEGGQQIAFGNSAYATIAEQIALDEQTHVKLLRTLLGTKAIAKPEINLAALGEFSTLAEFFALARAFEDVGVSAYGGAAPLIQSNAVLAIAARIALTEGEHTGNLRLLVALNKVATKTLDSQDILPPPSGTQYFSNVAGLTIVRSTSEVLAIVYGNKMAGTKSGAFFPDGVNGSINTVS